MNLAVFGAGGPTGRLVAEQALAAGHRVTAVMRRPLPPGPGADRLDTVIADVTDAAAVVRALVGAQAVISTIGVPYRRKAVAVCSYGITNILRAMAEQDVTRLVCVSSTAVAREEAPGQTLFWRKVLVPFLRATIGRTVYDDMTRMEAIVQRSAVDWTVVRPAGLFNAPAPSDDYQVDTRRLPGRYTSRADLAQVLVRAATQGCYSHSTVEVVTRSATTSALTVLVREVFRVRRQRG